MSDIERELGRLAEASENINERVDRIAKKLDKHIEDQQRQLRKIEQQLSLSRFLWLTAKAVILTVAFLVAFKFGDIASLWKGLK